MRPRSLLALAAATALTLLLAYALRPREEAAPSEPLRSAFPIPQPAAAEKLDFFFRLLGSGQREDLGSIKPSTWEVIGMRGLASFGREAAEYLIAPERDAAYAKAPDLLSNALRMLGDLPGTYDLPGLYPFLTRWLKEAPHILSAGEMKRGEEIRRSIFEVMAKGPGDERAVPWCEQELTQPSGESDVRQGAILILIRCGRAARVGEMYDLLPPNDREPNVNLRVFFLDRILEMAGPGMPPQMRLQAMAMTPLLERAAQAPAAMERIRALGCLLRLGREEAAQRLVDEYHANLAEPMAAWFALQTLAEERPHPFCRERFLEAVRDPRRREAEDAFFQTSVAFLGLRWPNDPEVAAELWSLLEGPRLPEPSLLARVAQIDRARMAAIVRREIASGDPARRRAAVNLARTLPMPEAGPWILESLQKAASESERSFLYSVLTSLRTPGLVSLLRSDLASGSAPLRTLAASCLIDLDDTEGVAEAGRILAAGDADLLEVLLQRALSAGGQGVPEALLPSLLHVVASHPSELERRRALYVLRLVGRLDPVREGLLDAYRREPSTRVAAEIRSSLIELAHR